MFQPYPPLLITLVPCGFRGVFPSSLNHVLDGLGVGGVDSRLDGIMTSRDFVDFGCSTFSLLGCNIFDIFTPLPF